MSLDTDNLVALKSHQLKDDLIFEQATVQQLQEPADGISDFKLHFWPKDYYEGLSGWDLEANRMAAHEIEALGVVVTKRRAELRATAIKAGQEDRLPVHQKATEKLASRMNRGYFHGFLPRSTLHQAMKADVPPGCRK